MKTLKVATLALVLVGGWGLSAALAHGPSGNPNGATVRCFDSKRSHTITVSKGKTLLAKVGPIPGACPEALNGHLHDSKSR